jgi:hypothetical protein
MYLNWEIQGQAMRWIWITGALLFATSATATDRCDNETSEHYAFGTADYWRWQQQWWLIAHRSDQEQFFKVRGEAEQMQERINHPTQYTREEMQQARQSVAGLFHIADYFVARANWDTGCAARAYGAIAYAQGRGTYVPGPIQMVVPAFPQEQWPAAGTSASSP